VGHQYTATIRVAVVPVAFTARTRNGTIDPAGMVIATSASPLAGEQVTTPAPPT